MKKIFIATLLILTFSVTSFADNPYFIDFNKVLNFSKPGAEAQKKLKQKIQSETKKFNKLESDIKKEESEIISQIKAITPEEYQKKVVTLRKKVADLQKNKQKSFNDIAKSRNGAKQSLLKAVNPIIKKYMEEKKIRMVIDKKALILADEKLDITKDIIKMLNQYLKSIKLN